MHQFRKILVGVDVSSEERLASPNFGAATREAVRRGVWLGRELKAEVCFQAVLDLSAHTEAILQENLDAANRNVLNAAEKVVQDLANSAIAEGVNATSLVTLGTPWEQLTRKVIRDGHDLLLVGSRNRTAAARFFFGSTANKLVRNCPCPVWVTKPDPKFDDINMLVACDLGPEMDHVLHLAVGGGRLLDAKVHLVHVLEYGADQGMWRAGVSHEVMEDYRRKARETAEQTLRERLSHTDFRTIRSGVQVHIVEGDADAAIVDAINRYGIDLLVMGTKARSGVPGLFVGNTAERLLNQVQCSLFVVKPANFVSPLAVH